MPATKDLNRHDDCMMAGVLFGLLNDALGFGYLSMHEDRKGFFAYQWSFEAGHNQYGNRYVFNPLLHRIDQLGALDDLAEQIANQWKAFHRGCQPPDSETEMRNETH